MRSSSSISFRYWELFMCNIFLHSSLLLKNLFKGLYNTILQESVLEGQIWFSVLYMQLKIVPVNRNKNLRNITAYLFEIYKDSKNLEDLKVNDGRTGDKAKKHIFNFYFSPLPIHYYIYILYYRIKPEKSSL